MNFFNEVGYTIRSVLTFVVVFLSFIFGLTFGAYLVVVILHFTFFFVSILGAFLGLCLANGIRPGDVFEKSPLRVNSWNDDVTWRELLTRITGLLILVASVYLLLYLDDTYNISVNMG